jgi:hypothetical protein
MHMDIFMNESHTKGRLHSRIVKQSKMFAFLSLFFHHNSVFTQAIESVCIAAGKIPIVNGSLMNVQTKRDNNRI